MRIVVVADRVRRAWLMLGAPAAQAKKRASAAQSAAMWKVVDPGKRCRTRAAGSPRPRVTSTGP